MEDANIYITDIATQLPGAGVAQSDIAELMKARLAGGDRRTRALIHRLYARSGIEKRHIADDGMLEEAPDAFFRRAMEPGRQPGTAERSALYARHAPGLFEETARTLAARHREAGPITHVITVSCTGFYAPGPDLDIVKALGLPGSTQRFHVGFMGCYGVFPALKMARAFCLADPGARVLVISVELCSLHFQCKTDLDNLTAASLFADGAAGALVSRQPPRTLGYRIESFASSLIPEGEGDMAWRIGDTGFEMVLSSYVPDLIGANLKKAVAPLFSGLPPAAVDIWAVHPGGRAVLDVAADAFSLSGGQLAPSREVLARCGNMSSATILFVLEEALRGAARAGASVLPLAFGPGLSVEAGLLTCVDGSA